MKYKLYYGDCLEIMDKLIEEGVKVDMILTDPPYGTTTCKWDSIIPFDKMWERLDKLIKTDGVVALFGKQPFTAKLICSNIKNYRYDWIWEKTRPHRYVHAKRMPLAYYENISIFYKKTGTYNPIMRKGTPYVKTYTNPKRNLLSGEDKRRGQKINNGTRYPSDIIKFGNPNRNLLHPTQKPVDLLEYLIKTYTNEGDLVLDFTMGSGSTGVAALNTNRRFVGIELDEKYFNIAVERLKNLL